MRKCSAEWSAPRAKRRGAGARRMLRRLPTGAGQALLWLMPAPPLPRRAKLTDVRFVAPGGQLPQFRPARRPRLGISIRLFAQAECCRRSRERHRSSLSVLVRNECRKSIGHSRRAPHFNGNYILDKSDKYERLSHPTGRHRRQRNLGYPRDGFCGRWRFGVLSGFF